MADERILTPIRRFFTTVEQVTEVYRQLFEADWAVVKKLTVIVCKSSEGEK